MLNYPFANSYNVEFATTYSTLLGQPKWNSFDLQVTPEWSVTPHVDLMGALYMSRTFQNESLTTNEYREMLGARIHFTPNKRILSRLLVRLEHRSLEDTEADTWTQSTRSRLRVETLTPLNRKSMYEDKLWYAIVDAEVFIVNDKDVHERFANRLRVRGGVGYRISYGLRVEVIYMVQRSRNETTDGSLSTDNIFRFRIKQYLHRAKPSTATGTGN